MPLTDDIPPAPPGLAQRLRVWRAGLGARPAEFLRTPEPRSLGDAQAGRLLVEGVASLGARRIPLGDGSLWDPRLTDPLAEADRHGFAWLDDLAAEGTRAGAGLARRWTADWLRLYGSGRGPGWDPAVAGRRLLRWVHHAALLDEGANARPFRIAVTTHMRYLTRHWRRASTGRDEALCGLIVALLAVRGPVRPLRPAIVALERLCAEEIGLDGGIASRRAEDLENRFALLVWTEQALAESGLMAQAEHRAAITRIAPVLRALRHANGGLARFQGGGPGVDGRLEALLSASRVRATPAQTGMADAMGYARLARGRVTVILDAGPPPEIPLSAHAGTLGLEMTAGRRPLIVSCGSGRGFGADWEAAARSTGAHSTLVLDNESSAAFVQCKGGQRLENGPGDVQAYPAPERGPASLDAAHDGYAATYGLIHVRRLDLSPDGSALAGEDLLTSPDARARHRLSQVLRGRDGAGLPVAVRFHLHPEVTARPMEDGTGTELMLKSGELWLFRVEGDGRIALDPSVYLEKTQARPVPTRQIVVTAAAVGASTAIRWSLTRASADRATASPPPQDAPPRP